MSKYPAVPGLLQHEHVDSYSQLVSAPGPYLEFGEFLYLEASSTDASATLRFSGKFLSLDAEIRSFTEEMTITGTGNQTAVTSRIGPCWLMGFSVRVVAGTITDGEIVASVHVARAGASTPVHVMTLASGDVTNTRSLGLGGYTVLPSTITDDEWEYEMEQVTNPAAGAAAVWSAPAGYASQVVNVECRFTTSVAVANRLPGLTLIWGAGGFIYNQSATVVTAGLSPFLVWSVGIKSPFTTTPGTYTPLASDVTLRSGDTASVGAINLQGADQVSDIYVSYRRRPV